MSGKVELRVRVDKDVYQAFKDAVYCKYGTLRGYLGEVVQKLMEQFLKDFHGAHTQDLEHITSKPNKRHIKLLKWLLDERPHEVLYSEIVNFVRNNFGIDKRTIRKYVQEFLISGGFVKAVRSARDDYIMSVRTDVILGFLKKYLPAKDLEKYRSLVEDVKEEEKGELIVKGYIAERVEAGDSVSEIASRLEASGFDLSKRVVRNTVRKLLAEREVF
jgi:hypothetical protein